MSAKILIVEGTIHPNGHLEVPEIHSLKAGKVRVTIEPVQESEKTASNIPELFERIRMEPSGRSEEDIDSYIDTIRDEAESELREIERLQDGLSGE